MESKQKMNTRTSEHFLESRRTNNVSSIVNMSLQFSNTAHLYNLLSIGTYSDTQEIIKGTAMYLKDMMAHHYFLKNSPDKIFNNRYDIKHDKDDIFYNSIFQKLNCKETNSPEDTYLMKNKEICSICDIYKFMIYFNHKMEIIPPFYVIGLIYIERICNSDILINPNNYKILFIVAMVMAQKIFSNNHYKQTKSFSCLFPKSYTKELLRLWERELLYTIYHNTKINITEYKQMYKKIKSKADIINSMIIWNQGFEGSIDVNAGNVKNIQLNCFPVLKEVQQELLKMISDKAPISLLKEKFSAHNFILAGYEIVDLVTEFNFTVEDFLKCKIIDKDGNIVCPFSFSSIREQGGFTIKNFLDAKLKIINLKDAGFQAHEFIRSGYTAKKLLEAGYTISELQNIGFSKKHLEAVGDVHDIPKIENAIQFSEIIIPPETERLRYKKKRCVYFEEDSFPSPYNILNPDVGELLFCISAVIQSQTVQDHRERSSEELSKYPDFDLIPDLHPDFGGEENEVAERILNQEAPNDLLLRSQMEQKIIPTINKILKFLCLLRNRVHYSIECNIYTLILLNKVTSASKICLTNKNWRSLWATCLLITQRNLEEYHFEKEDFSLIIPDFENRFDSWEKFVLDTVKTIQYEKSMYTLYYFELRQIFTEIIGPRLTSTIDVKYKPVRRQCIYNLKNKTVGLDSYFDLLRDKITIYGLSNLSFINQYKCKAVYGKYEPYCGSRDDLYADSSLFKVDDRMQQYRVKRARH